MNPQRLLSPTAEHLGPVANVDVPQLPRVSGLPATAVVARRLVLLAQALQAVISIQSPQRVDADFARGKPPLSLQHPDDERGGHRRVLASNLEQQTPGEVVEDAGYARVVARLRA